MRATKRTKADSDAAVDENADPTTRGEEFAGA